MALAQKTDTMSAEEFYAWHAKQDARYELVDGTPVPRIKDSPLRMMTGASKGHNRVNTNLVRALASQLDDTPCGVFANEMAVRTGVDQVRYPDLVIDCGGVDEEAFEASEPVLVVEILSPSTRHFDLSDKLFEYQQVSTLKIILMIDWRNREVRAYSRSASEIWSISRLVGGDGEIELGLHDLTLKLSDIFKGLKTSD